MTRLVPLASSAFAVFCVVALAGCAGSPSSRASRAWGDGFSPRLDSLRASARGYEAAGDTAQAVDRWVDVAWQAGSPPRGLGRDRRAAACAHADDARAALERLHPGPLVLDRTGSVFLRGHGDTRIFIDYGTPEALWARAARALRCARG